MKIYFLQVATAIALLCGAVILVDALGVARAALRRRRRVREGTYGAVVNARGRVLGIYMDPFSRRTRGARVHRENSPWTRGGSEDVEGWAWEGFGPSEEEALFAANRLRRRHVLLLPWLVEETGEEWKG